MFFMNMDDFLQNIANSENASGICSYFAQQCGEMDGQPIVLNNDGIPDGIGFDIDSDGKCDIINFDFNHDGIMDAIGKDTTGNGIIDTIYYDFDHDGIADAIGQDTLGNGSIDTITFFQSDESIHSDIGFSFDDSWTVGLSQYEAFAIQADGDTQNCISLDSLGLHENEADWVKRALEKEQMSTETAKNNILFGSSVTCWGGRKVCLGCAGILIDSKIGCQSGACTGGRRV